MPLRPSDFQFKLIVYAHATARPLDYSPPVLLRAYVGIGPFNFEPQLRLQPEPARELGPGRIPGKFWEYHDKAPFATNFNESTKLKDLIGKQLRVYIPTRAFKFSRPELANFQFFCYLGGKEVMLKPDEQGRVEIEITMKMISGSDDG